MFGMTICYYQAKLSSLSVILGSNPLWKHKNRQSYKALTLASSYNAFKGSGQCAFLQSLLDFWFNYKNKLKTKDKYLKKINFKTFLKAFQKKALLAASVSLVTLLLEIFRIVRIWNFGVWRKGNHTRSKVSSDVSCSSLLSHIFSPRRNYYSLVLSGL